MAKVYRKFKKTYKRRNMKKRYGNNMKRAYTGRMLARGINPFPDRYRCKLVFAGDKAFSGAGTIMAYFRGLGAYDPLATAGGLYPVGFAKLATIYNKYYCSGSKIKVRLLSTGQGANLVTSGRFCLYPTSTGATVTNIETAIGLPYTKETVVGGAGAMSIAYLSNYITGKKFNGDVGSVRANHNYQARTNSNLATQNIPNADFLWIIAGETVEGNNFDQVKVYVTIKYYIEFFDRIDDIFAGTPDNDGPTGGWDYFTHSGVTGI